MSTEMRVTLADSPHAQAYLSKLVKRDRANVERIVEMVGLLSNESDEPLRAREREQHIIFGAYAIGGWLEKDPPRPDIDLLVVTNVDWEDLGYVHPPWKHEYVHASGDSFIGLVAGHFNSSGFDVEIPDAADIPDEYAEGVDQRMMLRLRPKQGNECLPVDIVYISGRYGEPGIRRFEDFYEQDVTDDGEPMKRLPLLESVVTIPVAKYRP